MLIIRSAAPVLLDTPVNTTDTYILSYEILCTLPLNLETIQCHRRQVAAAKPSSFFSHQEEETIQ